MNNTRAELCEGPFVSYETGDYEGNKAREKARLRLLDVHAHEPYRGHIVYTDRQTT